MASIRELRAKFTADTRALVTGFREASREAAGLGTAAQQSAQVVTRSFSGLTSSTSQLRAALGEVGSDDSFDELRQAIERTEREVEQFGSASESTMQDLGRAIENSGNHFSGLSDDARLSLSRIESAVNAVDAEIRTLGSDNGLGDLGDDARQAANQVDDIGDSLDEVADSADSASGSLIDSFGKVGIAAAGLAGGIAAAAGSLGLFIKGGDDLQRTLNGMEAATGATGGEMEGMESALKNIYKNNYGESFDDIAESMTNVKQTTGLTGEELEKMTQNGLMLRDTFKYDVGESVRSANGLMKNFGESGEEAYALIAEGSQRGLNYADDLLGTIDEYSVYYEKAGFSAQDMFGQWENAKNAGVFNLDYAADAFKEFGIIMTEDSERPLEALAKLGLPAEKLIGDFAKGGDSAKAAFQTIAEKLGGVKDPLTQTQIGIELFGTKFEDMGADAVIAMSQTNDSITGTTDVLKGIDKIKYNTIGEAIKGMGRAFVVDVLIPLQDRVMPYVNSSFNTAKENVDKFKDAVKAVFAFFKNQDGTGIGLLAGLGMSPEQIKRVMDAVDRIKTAASALWTSLQNAFAIGAPIIMAWWSKITNFLTSAFELIMPKIMPLIQNILKFVGDTFKKIVAFWESDGQQLMAAVENAFNVILSIIKFVMPVVLAIIKSVWGNIKGVITGALDIIMGVVKIFSGLFTGDFAKMWEGVKQLFSGAVRFIWNFVQLTFYGKILGGAKAFILAFKGGFAAMWTGVKALFTGGIGAAWTTIKNGWSMISTHTTKVFKSIWGFLSGTFNAIKNIITFAVKGYFNIIRGGWSLIFNTTKTIFLSVFNFLKGIFVSIRNSISGSVSNILTKVRDTWNLLKTNTSGAFRDIFNGIKNKFTDIVNLAKGLPKRIGDGIGAMASKVTSGVTKVINALARTLGKGVNGVIGGVNWVLGKIGVDKDIPKWDVPQYAQGTKGNGAHPGGPMIVGDGKGSNAGPELIETPDGKQMLSPKKPTLTSAPKGTKVWSATATREILKMIPHYAFGDKVRAAGEWVSDKYEAGKNVVKSAAKKVKDVAVNAYDYIKSPGKFLDLALKTLGINKPKGGDFGGNIAGGAWNKVKSSAIDFIKGKLSSFGESQSGITVMGGNGGGFGAPFRLTSKPGPRNTGIPGASTFHKGWDWAAPTGTPIPSVSDGVVTRNSWHPLSGNFVEVKSGSKTHRYQHNSKNLVNVGQSVRKGQTIALVGATGVGSGSHLHYELKGYEDGGIVDGSGGAQLAWLTEGGFAESIISHDPSKKTSQRAIWEETGRELGFDTDNAEVLAMLERIAEGVESGHVLQMDRRTVAALVAPDVQSVNKRTTDMKNKFK